MKVLSIGVSTGVKVKAMIMLKMRVDYIFMGIVIIGTKAIVSHALVVIAIIEIKATVSHALVEIVIIEGTVTIGINILIRTFRGGI